MRSTIATGRTVDEAILNGTEELGLSPDSVTVEIISRGDRTQSDSEEPQAKVRVSEKISTELVEKARSFLADLIKQMKFSGDVTGKSQGKCISLEIWNSAEGSILIGYRGITLNALQHLVGQYMNRDWKPGQDRIEIRVDTQDYRQRRERLLSKMAMDAVKKARITGQAVSLETMNDVDRKFVHLLVKDLDDMESNSQGDGDERHIVISKKSYSSY